MCITKIPSFTGCAETVNFEIRSNKWETQKVRYKKSLCDHAPNVVCTFRSINTQADSWTCAHFCFIDFLVEYFSS